MKMKRSFAACIAIATAMVCLTTHADTSQNKAITDQVKSAFSQHPDVGTDISVMTKNGVVYLKGNTSTPLAKTHAEELAKAVPGVQRLWMMSVLKNRLYSGLRSAPVAPVRNSDNARPSSPT
jgi:BON domain